ncbi:MAG: site-specific integrase [Gemmatimonadota bacterium]|nr:site-specific integrase [Gemmatimonadota bacterium]
MASIKKTGSYYRVSYSVALPGRKKYRSRYLRTRQAAGDLKRQLERLEEATRTGVASSDQIDEWVSRDWLKAEEAQETFRAWREAGGPAMRQAVDFAALRAAYEDYALTHSKAGDAGRKSHRNHMGLADSVLRWLKETHPRLDLTESDITMWLESQRSSYSPWTLHHKLTKLRLLLDQAVRLHMLAENPARQVSVPTPRRTQTRRVLSLEEVNHLLEASLRYRKPLSGALPMMVRLGLYAGLRNEEMCWCQWQWMDLERRVLSVQATVSPTGQRWIPKDAECRALDVKSSLVGFWVSERQRQADAGLLGPFVLVAGSCKQPQYRGRPLSFGSLQRPFTNMIRQEGMDPSITIYSLRHTYATMLLRAGVDPATVMARMGHSRLDTTLHYLHAIQPEAHPTDALAY